MTGRPDDDVVENRNAAQVSDFAQSHGQLDVRSGRAGISRRVVVAEDDRRGSHADEASENVSRMDLDPGEAPASANLVCNNPVPDVEGDEPELFDGYSRESGAHVEPDVVSAGQSLAELRHRADAHPRQFEGRSEKRHSPFGDGCSGKIGFRCVCQAGEAADAAEDRSRPGHVGPCCRRDQPGQRIVRRDERRFRRTCGG